MLIVLFVPVVSWLAQGRAGRLRSADILLVMFAAWCMVSLTAVHGVGIAMQTGGIQVLETVTPYFLARCCIRTADDFRALVRMLTAMVLILAPFAIIETVTGRNIYLELASSLYQTIDVADKDPRWGLRRVQLFFDHPILTGVCFGSLVALTHMVLGRELTFARRWLTTSGVGLMAALSLSSGPLGGVVIQIALMSWNRIFRRIKSRWIILFSIISLIMLAIQLLAKRPLINILLSYAFEPESAFFRTLIWDYGTQSVANHIWFGVGMGPWDRPSWMPPSIDMFWLYNAIIYGLPGGLFMFGAFAAALLAVIAARIVDPRHNDYRTAYLISMASFLLTGWAVHFWNGTYVLFLFLLGSGIWICDKPEVSAPLGTPDADGLTRQPLSARARRVDPKRVPTDRRPRRLGDRQPIERGRIS
ncbi:MAG: O-antigen ligase family protein [Devosia sp.]